MKIKKYKFRPNRLSTNMSIIGMLVLRDFEDIGNGVFAPVYIPEKKLELKKIVTTDYTKESLQKVFTKAQSALQSLKENGCYFTASVFRRHRTAAENDAFGKHSENQVAEVFYQELKGYDENDVPSYGKPKSLNEHILNLLTKYGESRS